jgi:hypothetical protein
MSAIAGQVITRTPGFVRPAGQVFTPPLGTPAPQVVTGTPINPGPTLPPGTPTTQPTAARTTSTVIPLVGLQPSTLLSRLGLGATPPIVTQAPPMNPAGPPPSISPLPPPAPPGTILGMPWQDVAIGAGALVAATLAVALIVRARRPAPPPATTKRR